MPKPPNTIYKEEEKIEKEIISQLNIPIEGDIGWSLQDGIMYKCIIHKKYKDDIQQIEKKFHQYGHSTKLIKKISDEQILIIFLIKKYY